MTTPKCHVKSKKLKSTENIELSRNIFDFCYEIYDVVKVFS